MNVKAKQYEVIGECKVHDHVKGERFWATYEPALEEALLGVHIAVVLEEHPRPRKRAALPVLEEPVRPTSELRRPPAEPEPPEAEEDNTKKEQ